MATIEKDPKVAKGEDPVLIDDGSAWLENGERMDSRTFLERYERTPEHFRAELIEGIVYIMASPLKIRHGRSGNLLAGCVCLYAAATPGTIGQDNTTIILGDGSVPQPDTALLILPECGGQSRDGEDDYTHGAPEMIIEVAYSSRSLDLNGKLRDYERAGVREYLVHDIQQKNLRWFELRDGRLMPLAADADGFFRSRVFPGFWIDSTALVSGNPTAVVSALNRGLASPEHAAFVAELERRRAERARGA